MSTNENKRQAFHLLAGTLLIIGVYQGFLHAWSFFLLLTGFLFLLLTAHVLRVIDLETLINKHERRATYFPGWGVTTFIAGFLAATTLFPKTASIAALIVLVYGDALATIIGHHKGTTLLPWNQHKSWEGLIAGLLVSFLIITLITGWPIALAIATAGAIVESVNKPRWCDDNLLLPIITGIIATILL